MVVSGVVESVLLLAVACEMSATTLRHEFNLIEFVISQEYSQLSMSHLHVAGVVVFCYVSHQMRNRTEDFF